MRLLFWNHVTGGLLVGLFEIYKPTCGLLAAQPFVIIIIEDISVNLSANNLRREIHKLVEVVMECGGLERDDMSPTTYLQYRVLSPPGVRLLGLQIHFASVRMPLMIGQDPDPSLATISVAIGQRESS